MDYGYQRGSFEDDDYDYQQSYSKASYQSEGRDRRPPRSSNSSIRDGRGQQSSSKYPENTLQRLDSIQDPGKRYVLNEVIGSGVCGVVYAAVDTQSGSRPVAVKIQPLTSETQEFIVEEYRIFRDHGGHPNIPDFNGIYRKRSGKKTVPDQLWIAMELCSGGPVMDLVRGLAASEKTMREEHISYILREVIKALIHLHENNVIHRDVKGSNILITSSGEVKLTDFGLAKQLKSPTSKCKTCIGSPSWMAPEVVMSKSDDPEGGYDTRADVWSIGITAIELAEGKAPFESMHATRALFQIVRNPPPSLYRPANWSDNFIDFINECLEKNPENRPVMAEILEHPFLQELPSNDYVLTQELKTLAQNAREKAPKSKYPECMVRNGFVKTDKREAERMLTEDLAALEVLTEDTILDELNERIRQGDFHAFVGDVLIILNPNEIQDIYGLSYHEKYNFKSRSDNAPHIYSVADKAYQDVLHNEEAQHIIFSGESKSGKTSNMMNVIKHLMYLGKSTKDIGIRLAKAMDLIQALTHAATPLNPNSTRCVFQLQTTFGSTGKASGAIFWIYQLEKWRVSLFDRSQSNFHIFYYLYDALDAKEKLQEYSLPSGRRMRYLRICEPNYGKASCEVRHNPQGNCLKFDEINEVLKLMEMEECTKKIWTILSAILILGEVRFIEGSNSEAEIRNVDAANTVANLLGLDQKKFIWSLTNYCMIKKGSVVRCKHTCEEANLARDILSSTVYNRLVDWIINSVNEKLSMTRTLFGDKFVIDLLDLFGFECFSNNRLEQLIVNTMNEQLQCYYNQRVFGWEMQEQEEEEIPIEYFHYYDNREVIERLMGKNYGLFQVLDYASRESQDTQYILEKMKDKSKGLYVKAISHHEFSVAHYTGKISYDATDIVEKNRDFVPPEMINTMRTSTLEIIKQIFTGQLTKSGNLTTVSDQPKGPQVKKRVGGKAQQEASKIRRYNTSSRGQFSQSRKMRTCAATFRSVSLEILKNLSVGSSNGGTHFVRCIRADLEGKPRGFYRELVRQQIRALAVLDTAKIRQKGFPHRIPFQEFLRRYKFLAFDFDENVEMTKDNCRLLLVRLKMEGWIIGKTKVFLKYYNEEYLSRLYETQVRKIVKIQCMLRAFLARKKLNKVNQKKKENAKKSTQVKKSDSVTMSEEDAALKIQKTFRGHAVRKEMGPVLKGEFDENTKQFIEYYSSKWKSKSIFQVLLQYRAARYQDLVQFCQQVHLYNQTCFANLQENTQRAPLDKIDPNANKNLYLDNRPRQVHKLPFDLYNEFPFFDTSYMNDPLKGRRGTGSICSVSDEEHESWDAPLRRQTVPWATQPNKKAEIPQTRKFTSGNTSYKSPGVTNSYSAHKKMPPPPIPINQKKTWNDNDKRKQDNWMNEDRNRNSINVRSNPIRELQAMGRRNVNNNDDSDDEPPFNFQAMLRKTPHQRDSMRRNPVYDSHIPTSPPRRQPRYQRPTSPYPGERETAYKSSDDPDAVTIYRSNSRVESPEWSPNEMVRMSEKYGREEPSWASTSAQDGAWGGESKPSTNKANNINNNINDNTSLRPNQYEAKVLEQKPDGRSIVQLAPGLIIEGYCADL
ncbi:neither inactivation nor afterpotential protein C isoform X2 [Chelonus insularis]|uniref:neither inactivation nor afterpotential protein C isoform X2 n=1 Tax=Chelonus insularis TaxID=460826 RepID=UPI00158E43DE|nr:neither inactivation nor afterpotential protein C isoform X2 [Chelonus insularis]